MIVHAHGQLRHRFWGTYGAFIGLRFKHESHAVAALQQLGKGWSVGIKMPNCLVWSGKRTELDATKAVLERFGADASAIDSLKHSVDFGEPFTCTFDIVPEEQLSLSLFTKE